MEVWKDIKDYEGFYQVSNFGNVRSLHFNKKKILCKCFDSCLYHIVTLKLNKKQKTFKVHRLVANTFIENKFKKETVNHINGIKTDNTIYNLEWATRKEQSIHSYKNSLQVKTNNVLLLNIQTGIFYNSIFEASKTINIHKSTLQKKINGIRKNNTYFIIC